MAPAPVTEAARRYQPSRYLNADFRHWRGLGVSPRVIVERQQELLNLSRSRPPRADDGKVRARCLAEHRLGGKP